MKKTIPLILISLIIAACTTKPAEIHEIYEMEDRYFNEMTAAESKNIFAIENKIIATNKERLALEKKLNDQAKRISETEKELKLLKDEDQTREMTMLLQHHQAENDYFEAGINLKIAEIAKYIAELKLEKSKIAAEYRDKYEITDPVQDSKSSSKTLNKKDPDGKKDTKDKDDKKDKNDKEDKDDKNDKYGYKKYAEDLEKKEKNRSKAETKFKEVEKKYLDTKTELEKLKP